MDRIILFSNRRLAALLAATSVFGLVTFGVIATFGCRLTASSAAFTCCCASDGSGWTPFVGRSAAPRKHVYFLKNHKCASTTLQRVLITYGIKHNLSIALPRRKSNNFYPRSFRPEIAKRTCAHPNFDVMAAHARFNSNAKDFMPPDTFFVSIVRDPAEQMESAYYYFLVRHCREFPFATMNFESYIKLLAYPSVHRTVQRVRYPCQAALMQFLQLHDFGLNLYPHPTKELVEAKIQEIDKSFHLVLVVERFDEGLIIMRDLLGWTNDDILYLKSNFRLEATDPLSPEVRSAAYALNWGDKLLYDHFRAKMDAMISRQKTYLRAQVREFRALQVAFQNYCTDGKTSETTRRPRSATAQQSIVPSDQYILSKLGSQSYSCQLAATSEGDLFIHLNSLEPICDTALSLGANESAAAQAAAARRTPGRQNSTPTTTVRASPGQLSDSLALSNQSDLRMSTT